MSQLTLLIELKKLKENKKNWRHNDHASNGSIVSLYVLLEKCCLKRSFYVSYHPMKASNIAYRKPSKVVKSHLNSPGKPCLSGNLKLNLKGN